jgi:hypothetical protein
MEQPDEERDKASFQLFLRTHLYGRYQPKRRSPTRHLGANIKYSSEPQYFTIINHTLLSTTKCRVGGERKKRQVCAFAFALALANMAARYPNTTMLFILNPSSYDNHRISPLYNTNATLISSSAVFLFP